MTDRPLISLKQIAKRFGSILALQGAELTARAGEIHVILGENGAGKTSLMSVLSGLYQPDAGEVAVAGQPVSIKSPADALRLGIAMVPQHVELVENLTVWENVILGQPGSGWLDRRQAREAIRRLVDETQMDINVDAVVRQLSAGQQQKVEILKTLFRKARVIILDEPTTFLTPQETDALYTTMGNLAARGMAVILVTHKLRDALRVGHRLTVMRAGRVVATVAAGQASEAQLVQWLMGGSERDSARLLNPEPLAHLPPDAPAVLELSGVTAAGGKQRITLKDVNLTLRRGEIRGIAGITGSGQRELAEAILGLLPLARGEIRLVGRPLSRWPVRQRLAAGLAIIPEDRIYDGILPGLPLYETLLLGQHQEVFPGMAYRAARAREMAAAAVRDYDIKAPGPDVPVSYLSGGNIQKVIVARAVQHAGRHDPAVVVAVNPTRGLDVRTVRQVHDRLRQVAAAGGAVLLMSEDLDELMAECHTISVMYQGRLVAGFDRDQFDRYRIGEAMLGRTGEGVRA